MLTGSIAGLGSHYVITLDAVNARTGDAIGARAGRGGEQGEGADGARPGLDPPAREARRVDGLDPGLRRADRAGHHVVARGAQGLHHGRGAARRRRASSRRSPSSSGRSSSTPTSPWPRRSSGRSTATSAKTERGDRVHHEGLRAAGPRERAGEVLHLGALLRQRHGRAPRSSGRSSSSGGGRIRGTAWPYNYQGTLPATWASTRRRWRRPARRSALAPHDGFAYSNLAGAYRPQPRRGGEGRPRAGLPRRKSTRRAPLGPLRQSPSCRATPRRCGARSSGARAGPTRATCAGRRRGRRRFAGGSARPGSSTPRRSASPGAGASRRARPARSWTRPGRRRVLGNARRHASGPRRAGARPRRLHPHGGGPGLRAGRALPRRRSPSSTTGPPLPSRHADPGVQLARAARALELHRGNPAKAPSSCSSRPRATSWVARSLLRALRPRSGPAAPARGRGRRGAVPEGPRPSRHRPAVGALPARRSSASPAPRRSPATRPQSRRAYQDFLALWKDADTDIPVLREARAEYAKLKD